MRKLSVATSGRHPFEVAFLVASLACGTALILSDIRPQSIQANMPGVVRIGWEVGLILSGLIGLIGVWWPGRFSMALAIELGALVLLGSVMAMYVLCMLAFAGAAGTAPALLISAISGASWWRAGQIIRTIRSLTKAAAIATVGHMSAIVQSESQ